MPRVAPHSTFRFRLTHCESVISERRRTMSRVGDLAISFDRWWSHGCNHAHFPYSHFGSRAQSAV